MRKAFTRGQTQVLFRHLPGAIFEHDDYGLCRVTSVTQEAIEVNKTALFDAVADALAMWSNARFVDRFPDPRDQKRQGQYALGSPKDVRYEPYPTTFTCRTCSRSAKFTDLVRRKATTSGNCPECGGRMGRMRYVQAHNCGRLEELFVPRICQHCKSGAHIAFHDPGRVKQARWYCRACKKDLQSMRMTPCKCAYSDEVGGNGFSPEKWMKVVPTGDPSLYISHTAAFVNFPDSSSAKLRTAPDSLALLLGRTWGLTSQPVEQTLEARDRAGKDAGDASLAEMVEVIRAMNPDHPKVKEYDAAKAKPKGQDTVDEVNLLLARYGAAASGAPRRWLVEHVTLQDRTSLSSTDDVAAMMRRRGDETGALEIEASASKAFELMGIRRIRVINDFPLTLSAFGYTRLSRDPSRAMLTPFPPDDRGKLPIYALSSETEALWFELDPLAVAKWLRENGVVADRGPDTEAEAWAWLYANVPGIRVAPTEPAYLDVAAVAVRTLLHTLSHVFLRRIEWSGFAPSSVGEYLIPGSLSFILYANRHAETRIGGLTTLFEQRLGTWLWDAVQSGHECVYDPICGDDGGTCAGCTHREHNCIAFNRELSRSTLYGGPLPGHSELAGRSIRSGYWQNAWQALPTS